MSKDLIRRSVAIKAFTFNSKGERIPFVDCDNFPVEFPLRYIVDTLVALPSADRPKGEWLCSDDSYENAVCSNCGFDSGESYVVVKYEQKWKACPMCEARMGGENNEND